jgi:hypothetical protein
MPLDANGNWIPEEPPGYDWNAYKTQMDRQLSGAGGVPTAMETQPPQAAPVEDPLPPEPEPPAPPTADQVNLEASLGIRTQGPAAEAATQAADAYSQGVDSYESATKQGRPQQFGTPEPMGLEPGPLSPRDAASAFMAKNPDAKRGNLGLNIRQHSLGSADRAAANAAYEERVQADRQKRAEQRGQQRERGYANRDAIADRNYRVDEQMARINGAMGGPSMPGGPSITYGGGAAFVGPGFGRQERESYRGGYSGRDPEIERGKLEETRLERIRRENKDTVTGELGRQRVGIAGQSLDLKRSAAEAEQKYQEAVLGLKKQGAEADKSEAVGAGVDAVATLVAGLDARLQHAKTTGDFTQTDVEFDDKGKAIKSPGAFPKRMDFLINRVAEMDALDPDWDLRLSESTNAALNRLLEAYRRTKAPRP